MKIALLALAAVAAAGLSGCDSPQGTLRALQTGISAYASAPTDEAAANIDANFSKLDGQIGNLRQDGKTGEADNLARQRDALQAQYAAARITAGLLKAKEAAATAGEAFRQAGEAFGQALKSGSTNNE
jgi:Spy/CpxP family protein refolding chaperone